MARDRGAYPGISGSRVPGYRCESDSSTPERGAAALAGGRCHGGVCRRRGLDRAQRPADDRSRHARRSGQCLERHAGAGCTDTDQNASDFTAGTVAPRNSSTSRQSCGGGTDAGPDVGADTGTDTGTDTGAEDRKSTRLNSSHLKLSRMPSSA